MPHPQSAGRRNEPWATCCARGGAVLLAIVLPVACSSSPAAPARPAAAAPAGASSAAPTGGAAATDAGPTAPGSQPTVRAATRPTPGVTSASEGARGPGRRQVRSWVYQLQGYPGGRLDALAATPHDLAVIDLARDAHADWFTAAEIGHLRARGKTVLAYFEIGSLEEFRPEYPPLRSNAPDLFLNRWPSWPDEYFVRYWDDRWWNEVVRPRVDQALRAGFDGVYLDTPLAYEELDLKLARGWTRERLAAAMVSLIVRISRYAKARRPGFWIVPQNSPELRHYPGYTNAIDGIGMEELFFVATDQPCTEDYCAENLAETRALRDAGKLVLAVDYARDPRNVATACARYRDEGFVGYVTMRELDGIRPECP